MIELLNPVEENWLTGVSSVFWFKTSLDCSAIVFPRWWLLTPIRGTYPAYPGITVDFFLAGTYKIYNALAYFFAHIVCRGAIEITFGPLEKVSFLEDRANLWVANGELIFGLCKR
jgi:hypothetical protein